MAVWQIIGMAMLALLGVAFVALWVLWCRDIANPRFRLFIICSWIGAGCTAILMLATHKANSSWSLYPSLFWLVAGLAALADHTARAKRLRSGADSRQPKAES